jgi:hypothetical protein
LAASWEDVAGLFDRRYQPTDQLDQFVQVISVMVPDRFGKPAQTFIVAEMWDVTGYDLRRRRRGVGLDVGHPVTSFWRIRQHAGSASNASIWRSLPRRKLFEWENQPLAPGFIATPGTATSLRCNAFRAGIGPA